jgi:hypothetical protein
MSLPILIATAGCPSATVTAILESAVGQLVGFMEFGALSVPPVLYLNYTASGGWTYQRELYGAPTWTDVGAGSGATAGWAWDAATGILAGGGGASGVSDSTQTTTNRSNSTNGPTALEVCAAALPPILSTDGVTPSGGNPIYGDPLAFPGDSYIGTEFQPSLVINSKTQATLAMEAASNNYGGGHAMPGGYTDSVTAGNLVFTLGNPDTEANAVARAALGAETITAGPMIADIFAAGIFSVWETRVGAGTTAFNYQGGTYQLNCANLVPGLQYHYVVVWEQATAAGNGTGDTSGYGTTWANSDAQSGDFTPGASSHAVAGLTIPVAQGYQKRIKSVAITLVGV